MKRTMTALTKKLYSLALGNHLSCPLGRAVATTNRHYNDSVPDDLEYMKKMKITIAKRWLSHWNAGGSLKKLGFSSEERNQERRKEYKEYRDKVKARM